MPSMEKEHIAAIEEILGYQFQNKDLVVEAMTHPSLPGKSYGRLKILGDAVLNFVVGEYWLRNYPNLQVAQLRLLRSANTEKEKLARIAVKHGLHQYLRHNSPQLGSQIQDFVEDAKNYLIHSNGCMATPRVLSGIIKSLIGAVFTDAKKSEKTAWKVFERLSDSFVTIETLQKHPVKQLEELCQNLGRKVKFNYNWDQDHKVDVFIDGKVICSTSMTHRPKKDICQNRAAMGALDQLKVLLGNNQLELFLNTDN